MAPNMDGACPEQELGQSRLIRVVLSYGALGLKGNNLEFIAFVLSGMSAHGGSRKL